MQSGYPAWQLAKAFHAALDAPDPAARDAAQRRIDRWQAVLAGMASGEVDVGSRTPVGTFPAWVSLQVARGGFATGAAAAGGALQSFEIGLAHRLGVPARRGSIFAHYLSEAGHAELVGMLADGTYRVTLPEEAALLTVTWLAQHGDHERALELLDTIAPLADQVRFYPVPAETPLPDPALVSRATAGEVAESLGGRRTPGRILALREALAVWNPFADEVLMLWLAVDVGDGSPDRFGEEWQRQARALLEQYRILAAFHQHCTKHRKPKENLAILLRGLAAVIQTGRLDARLAGLVRTAISGMTAKRGRPDTEACRKLRERQRLDAELPLHVDLARLVVARLSPFPADVGLPHPDDVLGPVTAPEASATSIPEGTAIPPAVRRVVRRALAGSIEELIGVGAIPSAEVLASFVPQITATTTALSYPDAAARSLAAATYRSFRNRRSLLLLNLERQVQLEELPWVVALRAHRPGTDDSATQALATLRRLATLTLEHFSGTLLPNGSIQEFAALSDAAGLKLPWLEELAADIFMGRFSPKFADAAQIAAGLLRGSLYAASYDIDDAAVASLGLPSHPADGVPGGWGGRRRAPADAFAALCRHRAGEHGGWGSVAANGKIIEQAQILTTHNLATLVDRVGVNADWSRLAVAAFAAMCTEIDHLRGNPRPLPTVKNAAYAWRQAMFFLSLVPAAEVSRTRAAFVEEARRRDDLTQARVAPILAGLDEVLATGASERHRRAAPGQPFLGWVTGRHWLLEITH